MSFEWTTVHVRESGPTQFFVMTLPSQLALSTLTFSYANFIYFLLANVSLC